MARHNDKTGEPLGFGGTNVILLEHFEHRRTCEAGYKCDGESSYRKGRADVVFEVLRSVGRHEPQLFIEDIKI